MKIALKDMGYGLVRITYRETGDVVGTWIIVGKEHYVTSKEICYRYIARCKRCSHERTISSFKLESIGRARPACRWCVREKRESPLKIILMKD